MDIISSHWTLERVVTGRGYDRVCQRVDCSAIHTSTLESLQYCRETTHSSAICQSFLNSPIILPLGERKIPNVSLASVTSTLLITFLCKLMSHTDKSRTVSGIVLCLQNPFAQWKSTRYQKVYSGTMAPEVAAREASHKSTAACSLLHTSEEDWLYKAICTRSVSSTNAKPE
jgi:hypothetical protein